MHAFEAARKAEPNGVVALAAALLDQFAFGSELSYTHLSYAVLTDVCLRLSLLDQKANFPIRSSDLTSLASSSPRFVWSNLRRVFALRVIEPERSIAL